MVNVLILKFRDNMKKINIVLIALAAVVLTGCKSLYGKYERPDVKADGLFRDPVSVMDTLAVNDTLSFGKMPWKQVFTDPLLQGIIEKTLENNVDLLNAALNVKMVEEQLKVAKLAFLPSVAVTPQGTISSFNGNPATKSYSLPVTASWNVDLFGQLLNETANERLSDGSENQYYLWSCKPLLHLAHA